MHRFRSTYDFDIGKGFTPYVGLELGLSETDLEFSASLLPARFNIDVEAQTLDIGIRYGF